MKFIVAVLLNILMGYTAYLYADVVPWWAFAIGCFLVGIVVPQKGWGTWFSGFLGLIICWGVLAYNIDQANAGLFSAKMAQLFPLGGSSIVLLLVTALVGGLIGSFSALTGGFLRYK